MRPTSPGVSVIAWAQGSSEAPPEGLESVLMQQAGTPTEVLLTSAAADAAGAIAEDHRIAVGGQTIRDLFQRARGEYLALFDLDDLWIADSKLASQVATLGANEDLCMSCHRVVECFEGGLFAGRESPAADGAVLTAADVLQSWSLAPRSSILLRREALDDVPPWCFEHPAWAIPAFLLARGGSAHWDRRRLALVRTRIEDAELRAATFELQLALYGHLEPVVPSRHLDSLGDGKDKLSALLALERAIPAGNGTVLVITGGDDQLLDAGCREAIHFPGETCGEYPGHLPADAAAAIDLLRLERERGAAYLVIPAASLWWLDHYADLADLLDSEATRVGPADKTVVYCLRPQA